MSLAILFHFLCAQHVSDINISIIRSLRLFCWITTLVVTQPNRNYNTHRTKNNTTNVVIQQHSRKLLMMDILMSETCWAHKKWNKIARDIKLVFYYSTVIITFAKTCSWPFQSQHYIPDASLMGVLHFRFPTVDISHQLVRVWIWPFYWYVVSTYCDSCWLVESSWNVMAQGDAREGKGKLANGVGSQYPSHYLGTWCIQHYNRW